MMPAIQDFERRLGILHQVEPILENAINTLSKVVDMKSSLPANLLAAPKPAPPPPPPAPKNNQLDALKALLAQAEASQAPAPEPEPAPSLGGLGGLAGLL